jgi:hypothetical protein
MADLSLTTATLIRADGRTLAFGRGTPWIIRPGGIIGWNTLPPTSKQSTANPDWHGNQPSPVFANGRTVIVSGRTEARADRDALVQAWLEGTALPADPDQVEELEITMGGRTLSVFGQITAAEAGFDEYWGQGRVPFKFQFECDDPRRYGPLTSVTVDIGAPSAGSSLPWTLPLAFPAGGIPGAAGIYNDGTAPAPMVATLRGPYTGPGIRNQTTGEWVEFGFDLGGSDQLTVDTKQGGALNGTYRAPVRGSVIQDLELQRGDNTVVAVGAPGTGATLTVAYRPANW